MEKIMVKHYDETKSGYVHSTYTGGMVDGPGIRFVVFLAGCTMRCKYCHNPDTWSRRSGTITTVGEIITEILKYKSYFQFTGGGVTISGGEPLNQYEFVIELLKACHDHGFHTALDTSGYATIDVAEQVLPHVDLLLLDIKNINPEVFENVTGVKIDKTLGVLDTSKHLNVKTWVRFVLVPGLTDNMDDIKKMAEFLQPFENIEKVEVLPFHKSGEHKWKAVNVPYELADTLPPTPEKVKEVQEIFM